MCGGSGLNGFERFWTHFGSIPVRWGEITVYAECGLSGFERFGTLFESLFESRGALWRSFRAFRFGRVQVQ